MTQRTAAHVGIWIMILAGLLFAINVFIVPHFASAFAEMGIKLPSFAISLFSFSDFMIRNGLFIAWIYSTLFVAIIVWYCLTNMQHKIS